MRVSNSKSTLVRANLLEFYSNWSKSSYFRYENSIWNKILTGQPKPTLYFTQEIKCTQPKDSDYGHTPKL